MQSFGYLTYRSLPEHNRIFSKGDYLRQRFVYNELLLLAKRNKLLLLNDVATHKNRIFLSKPFVRH
jgi:hypothetical protein